MTTPAPTVGRPSPPPRRDPPDRGQLHIAPLVLRRIAEHVADRAPGTLSTRRRLGGEQGSTAKVHTDGDVVELELDLALIYPRPIRETVAELRRRISAEVSRLTGRQVRTVAVTVSALLPEPKSRVE